MRKYLFRSARTSSPCQESTGPVETKSLSATFMAVVSGPPISTPTMVGRSDATVPAKEDK